MQKKVACVTLQNLSELTAGGHTVFVFQTMETVKMSEILGNVTESEILRYEMAKIYEMFYCIFKVTWR